MSMDSSDKEDFLYYESQQSSLFSLESENSRVLDVGSTRMEKTLYEQSRTLQLNQSKVPEIQPPKNPSIMRKLSYRRNLLGKQPGWCDEHPFVQEWLDTIYSERFLAAIRKGMAGLGFLEVRMRINAAILERCLSLGPRKNLGRWNWRYRNPRPDDAIRAGNMSMEDLNISTLNRPPFETLTETVQHNEETYSGFINKFGFIQGCSDLSTIDSEHILRTRKWCSTKEDPIFNSVSRDHSMPSTSKSQLSSIVMNGQRERPVQDGSVLTALQEEENAMSEHEEAGSERLQFPATELPSKRSYSQFTSGSQLGHEEDRVSDQDKHSRGQKRQEMTIHTYPGVDCEIPDEVPAFSLQQAAQIALSAATLENTSRTIVDTDQNVTEDVAGEEPDSISESHSPRQTCVARERFITLVQPQLEVAIKAITCGSDKKQRRNAINWWGEHLTGSLAEIKENFEESLQAETPGPTSLEFKMVQQAMKLFWSCGGEAIIRKNIEKTLDGDSNSVGQAVELIPYLKEAMMDAVDTSSIHNLVVQELELYATLTRSVKQRSAQKSGSASNAPLDLNNPSRTCADDHQMAELLRCSLTNQLIRQDVGLWLYVILTQMNSHENDETENVNYRFITVPETPVIVPAGKKAQLPNFYDKTQAERLSSPTNIYIFVRDTVAKEALSFFTQISKKTVRLNGKTDETYYVYLPRYIPISGSGGHSEESLPEATRSGPGFIPEGENSQGLLATPPQLRNLGPISDALVGRQSWDSSTVQSEIREIVQRCKVGSIKEWLTAWRINARNEVRKQLIELHGMVERAVE